jgi:coenzyme F420-0:L-glutamate ligase/coenzyme F420-1:gamma-L-glutamate ligase
LLNSSISSRGLVQVFPIRTKLIRRGDDLVETILQALDEMKLEMENGDILVVASKVVSVVEGRIVSLSSLKPSRKAKLLARKYSLEPAFVELVLKESDAIYGGVYRALYTLKDNILTANAGIDHKNAPPGSAILWPKDPNRSAEKIRRKVRAFTGKRIGVSIIDSRVAPLRMGTIGVTIGASGFELLRDCRVQKDLYGKPLVITTHALADDIASAAHLVMGESAERVPAAIVRGAPARMDGQSAKIMMMPPERCLFMGVFKPRARIRPSG